MPAERAEAAAGAVLAIDHGAKRCGFAVTDGLRLTTHPLGAFEAGALAPELLEHVAALAADRDVRQLVLGLPANLDGSEGPRAAEVRAFGARLRAHLPGVPCAFQDERLSTKAAEELMRDAGIPPRDRRKWKDAYSALVILRDWLEGV